MLLSKTKAAFVCLFSTKAIAYELHIYFGQDYQYTTSTNRGLVSARGPGYELGVKESNSSMVFIQVCYIAVLKYYSISHIFTKLSTSFVAIHLSFVVYYLWNSFFESSFKY